MRYRAALLPANCDPNRIRTCDRLLRRQMLYPAELWGPLGRVQRYEFNFKYDSSQVKIYFGLSEAFGHQKRARGPLIAL